MRKSWKSLVLKARDVMADPDIRSKKKTGAMKKAMGLVYDNRPFWAAVYIPPCAETVEYRIPERICRRSFTYGGGECQKGTFGRRRNRWISVGL